jgi:putative MATE family efflux protein
MEMIIDLGGKRLDTSAATYAIRFAVGSNGSLISLIINLAIGLSVGANVVTAQAIGAGDKEKVSRTVHTSVFISLVCGILMGIIVLIGAPTFLTWMKSPEGIIGKASLYLRIYAFGIPANILYNFGAAILRAKGDTARPMIYLTIAGCCNVALNIVLILLGFDVAGVAIATIVSHYVSAILLFLALMKETDETRLFLHLVKPHKAELLAIIRIGLPSGLLSSCFSLSNVIIQTAINDFGEILVSANSVAGNIEGFCYTSLNAVALACLSFTGQNFGAKKYRRIKQVALCGLGLTFLVFLIVGGAIFFLRKPLSTLYNANPEIVKHAATRLFLISPFYFLCGFNDVISSELRGMGRTVAPMFITLFCTCVFRIIWVFTACKIVHEPFMLYLSYPISWAINLSICLIYFIIVYKKLRKTERKNLPE